MINDVFVPEPKIPCSKCNRLFHSVCVNYSSRLSFRNVFICKQCTNVTKIKGPVASLSALSIRKTELSNFIEQKINFFLATHERLAKMRNPNSNLTSIRRVRVRLVLNEKHDLETSRNIVRRYGGKNVTFAGKDSFRIKTILVFQTRQLVNNVDNVDCDSEDEGYAENINDRLSDLCFFAFQVQEYDDLNNGPNSRRVYISYLDSVRLFKPLEIRTLVYQEIMLAYLSYVKKMGYKSIHIWACPPQSRDDDYIFYRHPIDQKIPTPERLQSWYKAILNMGLKRGILKKFSNLYEWTLANKITQVHQIPMFKEDYWPTRLEDLLVKQNNKKSNPTINDKKIFEQLQDSMKKFGNSFFVGQLNNENEPLNTQNDPDPFIMNDMLRLRVNMLRFFRENNLESSTVRRAIFTTTELITAIITNGKYPYTLSCNNCMNPFDIGQHCNVCDNYDLCDVCFEKLGGHLHETKVITADVMLHGCVLMNFDGSDYIQKDKKLLRLWDHSMFCKDQDQCTEKYCYVIRDQLKHFDSCQLNVTGGCEVCLRVDVMWLRHANKCSDDECVKNCHLLKKELNDPKHRQLKQEMRRKFVLYNKTTIPQLKYEQSSQAFFKSRVATMENSSVKS